MSSDDDEKAELEAASNYNDLKVPNDEESDVINDNLATTGSYHQVRSDESPSTTANRKDDGLKERDSRQLVEIILSLMD